MPRFLHDIGWSTLLHPAVTVSFFGLILVSCEKQEQQSAVTPPETLQEDAPSEWPITRGGPSLQGFVDAHAPTTPKIEWTYELEKPVYAEAAVLGNTLVVGDVTGVVHAIDLYSRESLWTFDTDDTIEAAPTLHGGRVFVGSSDQKFYALDLQNGQEQWSIESVEKFSSSANLLETPNGTRLLVNGYDGTTRCLNPENGAEIWTYKTPDYINGTPALIDGRHLAFGGCDSVLHVLDTATGKPTSGIVTDAQITDSVATKGKMIYAANYANQVVAAELGQDELKWIYQADEFPFFTSPAVDEKHVYIGCRDKSLHAINRETGEGVWKFPTGGRIESSPLAFRDAVVFGSNDGRLYALDPATGKELWRLELGEKLSAAPVYANNRLIISGGGGTVFVIQ